MTNRTEVFSKEIGFIQNPEIKEIVTNLIQQLPEYFFNVPASSTGKYHPKYALGDGKLVRHTQASVRIANELLSLEMFKPLEPEKDYILSALILHDGLKHGETLGVYTVSNHPVLASEFIKNNCENKEVAEKIAELVLTHMGQWNTDYKTKMVIIPKPTTKTQNFVHLCDFLASRKSLEYNFEEV